MMPHLPIEILRWIKKDSKSPRGCMGRHFEIEFRFE
jgi:hypothetical protein